MVLTNANTGSLEKNLGSKAQALREDMSGLWSKKCGNRNKMQKMPRQKPSLEETRNRKVAGQYLI
jgi:hypothetical protein